MHLEDFLDWLSSVEKFFDWKELSEVYQGEITEHGICDVNVNKDFYFLFSGCHLVIAVNAILQLVLIT